MILDLERFLTAGRPRWSELERRLEALEADPYQTMELEELLRLYSLYQRASADLARLATFASEPEIRGYLEGLVARAYAEIHETRSRAHRLAPWRLLVTDFPRAFRRHRGGFALAALVTLLGAVFGGVALLVDADAREAIMPPDLMMESPAERVAGEEARLDDRLHGKRSSFSAALVTHNVRVAIACLALGMTWGLGTLILLFYNGALIGAVAADYLRAGQTSFLLAWLLPHGAVEIPAFLIAGQGGLVLAGALLGRRNRVALRDRLRLVAPDLGALIFGLACLLLWSAFIEAFLSQYHEPVLPYALKIVFGLLEVVLLTAFLVLAGRRVPCEPTP